MRRFQGSARDHDLAVSVYGSRINRAPPNTHPNPLSGWSEDRPDPEDIEAEAELACGMEHRHD